MMFEYSCFLHPRQKSSELRGLCPKCGRPFAFPLDHPPAEINGKAVEVPLRRGFYGAVYLTRHSQTGRASAVKVIPVATYDPEQGYGKDINDEGARHLELSGSPHVARLIEWEQDDFAFGDVRIPCHWMEMEYVEGSSLTDLISDGPAAPRQVAQIACDLFDVLDMLGQRGRHHNDLHGDNVKVTALPEPQARRDAIDPRILVKVLDFGSVDQQSRSTEDRLGDIHWVATHILALVNAYERCNPEMEPAGHRLTAQLRRVAEFLSGATGDRTPSPLDAKRAVQDAYRFGEQPLTQQVRLTSVGEHYNAQTMESWFAGTLLHDPDGEWTRRISRSGFQLIAGMRGCGKTILLRSLEWPARLHQPPGESDDDRLRRVGGDRFLGLFVSCSALLHGPRSKVLDFPLHRLFLAFAREAIKDVYLSSLMNVGEVDYEAVREFGHFVGGVVPWFEIPEDAADPAALERALTVAVQRTEPEFDGDGEFTPRLVFDELAASTRRLLDLWREKTLLFLLDDLSTRFLDIGKIRDLLSQLALNSPDFGIKISTESQTLELWTPSGGPARADRDYDIFDLGSEVYGKLRSSDGVAFLEEVLDRRARLTEGPFIGRARDVLGRQALIDVARAVRDQPAKTPIYWGLDVLAAICVGDIGDVLQLYDLILERGRDRGTPIDHKIQHQAMLDVAERKLVYLAGRDEWLYAHAVAFAEAANRELRISERERLRQYTAIFVKIDPEKAGEEAFDRVMQLIDNGVFVITGGTPRSRQRHGAPFVQFKLAYRKLLGLTNRIPLSSRDRFEPPGDRLRDWLEQPSHDKLERGTDDALALTEVDEPPEDAPPRDSDAARPEAPVQRDLFTIDAHSSGERPHRTSDPEPTPHALFTVETAYAGPIEKWSGVWEDKHVVAGLGFEDRSLGAWRNLLALARPAGTTLLQYADGGLTPDILSALDSANIPREVVAPPGDVLDREGARDVLERAGDRIPVVDVTSLTKPLIFDLLLEALLSRGEAWVLHTCAENYLPEDPDIQSVVDLFDKGHHATAFRRLDEIVAGERGPFGTFAVGRERRDPNRPSVMAVFVQLKYYRLKALLEEVPVERVIAIAPRHSAGPKAPRSVVARRLAEFMDDAGGSVLEVGSLDHAAAFDVLIDLHRRHALDAGYNFELALSGTKMHAVAAAMFASVAAPAGVAYSQPAEWDPEQFTLGTGRTRLLRLRRVESPEH